MKHLITKVVVLNTFKTLLECLREGKTITLRELTERINQLQRNANVNELVMASLLNTVYTHPNNEFTADLQSGIKFTKAEISALTVLCFECGQDVYPKWLTIGNKSDCANLMRDRNNTLVMLRAKHMKKPDNKELLKAGDVIYVADIEKVLVDEVLTAPSTKQSLTEVVGTEIVNRVEDAPEQFNVGAKKTLVSALELRTVPIEKKPFDLREAWKEATKDQVSPEFFTETMPGAGSDHVAISEQDCPVVDQEETDSDSMTKVYNSTADSMLLGDYRNLAMQLVRAAIWNEPVTFETLCRDVGVSKGRLSDMVINIVETLPDTMHAGLLRNLLAFVEKPNGDVPYWWSTANASSTEEDVRAMRKYVANGLSGQWHQLMQAHKGRAAKAAENNLVKFRCVEATVKSVLANILLVKGSSQFDIQSIMGSSVKEWDKGSGSTISQGNLEQTVFKSVSIIVWLDKVNNLPSGKKTSNEVAVTMEQNAYTQYGESGTWFYREFPVPHSVSIVEK